MASVNDTYLAVCDVLMESPGLSTGIVTTGQFLDYFSTVYFDWMQQTGLIKKLVCLESFFAISQYTEPGYAMDVQEVLYDDRYMHRESAFELDQLMRNWRTSMDDPRSWHEDRLPVNTVEILPTPNQEGHYVIIAGGAGLYGVPASVTATGDFTLLCQAGWYGTISSVQGAVYLEPAAPLYGIPSSLAGSSGNLTLIAAVRSTKTSFALTDLIEHVPDSFIQYLKFGVLHKIFSSDSEAKDVTRARYCGARWKEGILLAKAVSLELLDEPEPQEVAQDG